MPRYSALASVDKRDDQEYNNDVEENRAEEIVLDLINTQRRRITISYQRQDLSWSPISHAYRKPYLCWSLLSPQHMDILVARGKNFSILFDSFSSIHFNLVASGDGFGRTNL